MDEYDDDFDYMDDDFEDPYNMNDFDYSEDDEDDGDNPNNEDEKSEQTDGEGGRYGDGAPKQKVSDESHTVNKQSGDSGSKNSNWFSRFSGKINSFEQKGAEKAKNFTKLIRHMPPWCWIILAGACALIIIILLLMATISGTTAGAADGTNPENMTSNQYITSSYFYGRRIMYVDDIELKDALQLSYKQYAVDIFEQFENSVDVTLNITLPSNFDNATVINENITNISVAMGNIVATGNSSYLGVDFATLYPEIQYFGLTAEQGELINTFLTQYITDNTLITIANGSTDTIESLVDAAMQNADLQYIYNRCEKVMIKDELATENGLSDVQQRIYVGSIYMPNKSITLENLTYAVSNNNKTISTSIKVVETSTNSEIIHLDTILEEEGGIYDGFTTETLTLNQFGIIDVNNVQAYSNSVSLFEILKTYSQHFVKETDTNIYSWKPIDAGILYLEFSSENEFIFTELDLAIQNAE